MTPEDLLEVEGVSDSGENQGEDPEENPVLKKTDEFPSLAYTLNLFYENFKNGVLASEPEVSTCTYDIPDRAFEKPLHDICPIPHDVYAAGGDEEMSCSGLFGDTSFFVLTDRGKRDKPNDDGYLVMPDKRIAGVFDGITGGPFDVGLVATNVAIITAINESASTSDLPKLLRAMHKMIQIYKANNDKHPNIGTAATMVHINEDKTAEFVHAGDTRGMVIRNGEIVFKTRDDNLLAWYIYKMGISDTENLVQNLNSKKIGELKSGLTQCLGSSCNRRWDDSAGIYKNIDVHYERYDKTRPGDIILLCSDGLTGNFSNEEIARMVTEKVAETGSIELAIKHLTRMLIEKMQSAEGYFDNITILGIPVK